MRTHSNTILVTGGTSGIGRALAEGFHALGNHVIVTGRRQQMIDEIATLHPGIQGFAVDLAQAGAAGVLAGHVRDHAPDLNVLINNAGISRAEDLTAAAPGDNAARAIVQTNILATLDVTAALVPLLRQRPGATIITTTSGLAFVPRTNFPTYCASKAFLHSWVQSLRVQFEPLGIEVLELIPPYVQTELAGPDQASDPHAMPLADYVAGVLEALETGSPDGEIMEDRARSLRWADRQGEYDRRFAMLNPSRLSNGVETWP